MLTITLGTRGCPSTAIASSAWQPLSLLPARSVTAISVASQVFFPYSEPQESGNRTGIRWMTLVDAAGAGLKATALGDSLLQGGSYPCLMSDLEGPRHPCDIPKRDVITVNIDHAQSGVGGTNSWGARPLPKYQLPPTGTYRYAFRLSLP